jgi:RIO-like serine/threonine protein kinase
MDHIKKIKYSISSKDNINNEIELQKYVSNKYDFCPKIIDYKFYQKHAEIIMENIDGKTLCQLYSDEPENVPIEIWNKIRVIINTLFYEDGIEYIDISPYNFIVKNDKVYIIDFGHAYWCNKDKQLSNWFLKEFIINEENTFNPDFK